MAAATFPAEVWDGDSGSRDSDDGRSAGPSFLDWDRMIAEMQAVQRSNQGIDPDNVLNTVGVLATISGLSVVERGNAAAHRTIITFDEMDLDTIDGSAAATDACWGSQALYTFPEGHIVFLGAHMLFPIGDLEATTGGGAGLSDTATLEMGVGSTSRVNASDFDLSTTGTDQNIVPVQAGIVLAAGASDAAESSQATAALFLNGSAAAVVAYLNLCGATDTTDHGVTADVLKVSGTLNLIWSMQGDD